MVTAKDLEKISKFFYDVDGATFLRMFVYHGGTETMGMHLWSKYNMFNRDIGRFLGNLDSNNLRIIAKMINAWKGLSHIGKYKHVKIKSQYYQ